MTQAAHNDIIFIDSSLPALDTLLNGLPAGSEVVLLNSTQDGLAQMAAALTGRNRLNTIHILSHGSTGSVQLGALTLSNENLHDHAEVLAQVGTALAEDGDILLCGCEVAQGAAGLAFVRALSDAVGAHVSAASHKVGAAALGGHWTLDVAPALNSRSLVLSDWLGVLSFVWPFSIVDLNGDSAPWAGVASAIGLDVSSNLTVTSTDGWSGASLTVQRLVGSTPTPLASDLFSFNAQGFTVSGSNLQSGSTLFGTFINTAGLLSITFNSDATDLLVRDVMRAVQYRNDTPTGDTTIRFSLSDGTTVADADVTVTSDTIYVTNAADAATIDVSDGVSFSEAVAIAATDTTGNQTLVLDSSLAGREIPVLNIPTLSENLTVNADAASGAKFGSGTVSVGSGFNLTFTNGSGDKLGLYSSGAVLTGAGGLIKEGAGELHPYGANTHSGGTLISGGSLHMPDQRGLGSGTVTLDGGALYFFSNPNITNAMVIGLSGGRIDGGAPVTISGNISGPGVLTFTGGSQYTPKTLSGTNTHAATVVSSGGLNLSGGAAITDTGSITVASGATLALSSSETIGSLAGAGNVNLGLGVVGTKTVTTGGDNTSTTFSGVIAGKDTLDSVGTGNLALEKVGTGTFTLSGANTYTGLTSVTAGTLLVDGALANSSEVTLTSGATLGGSGSIFASGSINTVTLNGGTLNPGNNGTGMLTINGNLEADASYIVLDIGGTVAGTGYDQLRVNGDVGLGHMTLSLNLGSYVPVADDSYTLIANDLTDGRIRMPEMQLKINGDSVTLIGEKFTYGDINYTLSGKGGDGNDLVLTRASVAVPSTPNPFISGKDLMTVNEGVATTINGFTVGEFDSNDAVTVKIEAAHGTLSLGTTGSITGYAAAAKILQFSGTVAAVNTALNSLSYLADADYIGTDPLSVAVSDDSGSTWAPYTWRVPGKFYNPANGHYYELVTDSLTWDAAKTTAEARTFFGLNGYLATITTADEQSFVTSRTGNYPVFIGASDAAVEGEWRWVTGPEAGTLFWQGAINGAAPTGAYAHWYWYAPENLGGNEDYATVGADGLWNDINGSNGSYLVEYGGMGGTLTTAPLTVTVNAIPVLADVSAAVTFLENTANAAAQVIDSAVILSDRDNSFNGGSVTVRYQVGSGGAQDQLSILNAGGITVVNREVLYEGVVIGFNDYDASGSSGSNLRVSLYDQANPAAVTALVQALAYKNTSNAPAATRTVAIEVNDGRGGEATSQVVLTVTAENDAPVLLPAAVVGDFNDGFAALTSSQAAGSAGVYTTSSIYESGGYGNDINPLTADGHSVMTRGTALVNFETPQTSARLSFVNPMTATPGGDSYIYERFASPYRTVTFLGASNVELASFSTRDSDVPFPEFMNQLRQGSSSLTLEQWAALYQFSYTAVVGHEIHAIRIERSDGRSDQFAIDTLELGLRETAASLTPIAEDVLSASNAGNTVASLIATGRITDGDLNAAAPKAIAVSAMDNTHGTWQFQAASGAWTAFDFNANPGKALLLASTDEVRFVPNANFNGSVANGITFHAWDQSTGSAGAYLTVEGNQGGTGAMSLATSSVGITVTPVDEPNPNPNPTPEPTPVPAPEPTPVPTPTPTPTPAPQPTPAVGTNGIAAPIENAVPGLITSTGQPAAVGDGNGDGLQDSTQVQVASLSFLQTPTVSTPGTATSTFVSLVVASQDGKVTATSNANASLSNVAQKDAPANLPAELKMPLGRIAFSANVGLNTPSPSGNAGTPVVGVSETFSLYVDPSLEVNGYWKQNTAGTWVNLASAAYGGKIVTEGGKTRLDFTLTDGGQFDADGKIDGIITDPGAAASMPLSLVGYAPTLVDGTHFWF